MIIGNVGFFVFINVLSGIRPAITGNVSQLPVVRFETVVYRKATNKDRMFVGICNAK